MQHDQVKSCPEISFNFIFFKFYFVSTHDAVCPANFFTVYLCELYYSCKLYMLFCLFQRFKFCCCCDFSALNLKNNSERQSEISCKCDELNKNIVKKLNFLEPSIQSYKAKFHPVSYLIRSAQSILDKLMNWNQFPRPCEYAYGTNNLNNEVTNLSFFITSNIFNEKSLNFGEFYAKIVNYLYSIDCSTFHR